ncbi:MAG: hypothetical protein JSV02_08385 [Dehalococcoidia bacterium]|nr:MAG: hypothetical protein JSV02_08385 [Dehalococcoidia bacterium]
MVISNDEQRRGGFGIQRLRVWGLPAEKYLFSLDETHWTNSFALWIVLNSVDSAITWRILSLGGSEVNPFLSLAAQTYGYDYMLAGKMMLAVLLGMLVWRKGSRRLKSTLNLGINLVVIINCCLLFQPMWLLH